MFSLIDLLGASLSTIRIIDVGAMQLGDIAPPYAPIMRDRISRVIGFEPVQAECDKLNAKPRPGHTYLPYFIGDGSPGTFRECRFTPSSSLYVPNAKLRRRFAELAQYGEVVKESAVTTTRLDDIPEIKGADYIKLDIQGGELKALEGAERLLKGIVFVETEVELVPMYEGQPLFAEVDQELRKRGFLFHTFSAMAGRSFVPVHPAGGPGEGFRQMLWGDAVYVKDFTRFSELEPEQLLKIAAIAHDLYGSPDLAALALQHHQVKTGSGHWRAYMMKLMGTIPEAPGLE